LLGDFESAVNLNAKGVGWRRIAVLASGGFRFARAETDRLVVVRH